MRELLSETADCLRCSARKSCEFSEGPAPSRASPRTYGRSESVWALYRKATSQIGRENLKKERNLSRWEKESDDQRARLV